MLVYRIANSKYANQINGEGAKLYGGRWNPMDYAMLYAASHISLAALEIIVHNPLHNFEQEFTLIDLQLPELEKIRTIDAKNLKKNWHHDMTYTQDIGKDFLRSELLYMKVPSIVISREFNILINPNHLLFKKVKITHTEDFKWDKRLQ
jgi:RES domain-containing protein